MLVAIFVLSLALLAYVYAGYPVLARLLGAAAGRTVRHDDAHEPTVTVVIAAYNEAAHIADTVRNKLEQDYPADKLDVIVVSDESEDGTDELVTGLGSDRVRLIRQVPRQGKTSGLNLALPEATGEIIVFSDANSLYAPDTIRLLVSNFADPAVGYVTGRMVYKAPDGSLTGEGCSAYMQYENKLREWETQLGSVVGVDGGVDAMRREIYTPMNADQLPDFVQPLTVREQGHRVVYEPRALLYEDALADSGDEYRMRVRVGLRAFHALKDKAALLDPVRFGVFAWQLWSHKALRYMAFLFQAAAFTTNWALASRTNQAVWVFLFLAQIVVYAMALYGHTMTRQGQKPPRLVSLVYFLCVVNLASAQAFWRFLRGQKQVTLESPHLMKTPRPEPAVRPPRFLTDPRFGLALLLVLIVPFLVPIPMELRRHPIIGPLGNQVHVVLMGVFTLLFYWWGPLRGRLLGSALATAGLGVAIEIVQMPLGRSAAVFDVVLDLVGVAIICGWVIWRGHGRRAGFVLAVAAFLVVPYRIYDLPFEAAASYAARDSFPLLADLEGRHDRWLWLGNGARLEVATPADGPGRVVRVTSKPDSHWPGAEFRHFPHDWSAADSLLIDLRLVSGPAETQRMGIRLDDFEGRHDESWVGVGAEIGPAWTTVRIPLRDRMTRNEAGPTGRPFDLHDVDRVLVFGHRPTGPIVFEVDNVRLTLAPRTGFDLPSDDP